MSKIILTLGLILTSISLVSAQTNSNGQLNCSYAYGQLNNAANNLEYAARNIVNQQQNVDRQYEIYTIRMEQYQQQLELINYNEQQARSSNRANTGACVVNNFLGGFLGFGGIRLGGCAIAPINNSIFITNTFNNQRKYLELNKQAWTRAWISQQQRFLANVQKAVTYFNVQKVKCDNAQAKVNNCFLYPNQPPVQYNGKDCDIIS